MSEPAPDAPLNRFQVALDRLLFPASRAEACIDRTVEEGLNATLAELRAAGREDLAQRLQCAWPGPAALRRRRRMQYVAPGPVRLEDGRECHVRAFLIERWSRMGAPKTLTEVERALAREGLRLPTVEQWHRVAAAGTGVHIEDDQLEWVRGVSRAGRHRFGQAVRFETTPDDDPMPWRLSLRSLPAKRPGVVGLRAVLELG